MCNASRASALSDCSKKTRAASRYSQIEKYKYTMKCFVSIITGCVMASSLFLTSCDKDVNKALEYAGDNRGELENVLEHFKDDSDGLKLKSAKFLISNMPYNYTYAGDYMDAIDSAYLMMAECPTGDRAEAFKRMTESLADDRETVCDLHAVKSDYLIRNINEACEAWRRSTWSKSYPDDIFLDYVLPYRLLDEPLSQWRNLVREEYPFLTSNAVLSKRGLVYEAEDASYDASCLLEADGASGKRLVRLSEKGHSVSFSVTTSRNANKQMFMRYTAPRAKTRLLVYVNGVPQDTLRLHPTHAEYEFADSRKACDLALKKGKNVICLSFAGDTVGVDYIRLDAIERYNDACQEDYSKVYCRIENKATHRCLTIASAYDSLPCVAECVRYDRNQDGQWLRMNYRGFGCWGICAHADTSSVVLETEYCSVKPGSSVGLYRSLNGSNQKWVVLPAGGGYCRLMNKDSGMYLEAIRLRDRDTLVQRPYGERGLQKWRIVKGGKRGMVDNTFEKGSALSEALRVFDITNQYEWVGYGGVIPPRASSLLMGKTGNCRDEADFTVLVCRSLGIPAAVDFTPHWGNRSSSHSWSVLIKPDGTGTPFYMGCAPCDTAHYYHPYKKPKVFRYRYQLNRKYAKDLNGERDVPDLFKIPKFTDVTDEYYETSDVVRKVPAEYAGHHVAYICVFDNRRWIPVHYGVVKDGRVTFSSMGRGIMYMAAFYENGTVVPFGNPFSISSDGKVTDVIRRDDKKVVMKLLRKYPFMGKEDFFNLRMSGGKFQGADNSDFSDAVTLYTFHGATNGNWYDVKVDEKKSFKFLRYIGPSSSHCNINELEFFDGDGKKIGGDIIGTEGESWAQKENVFDGNILSGFSAISPDGNWVGLRLNRPRKVERIRFIGRNDGNGIEIGNDYELLYWDGYWRSFGRMKAVDTQLVFKNVPSGGLYVLSNLTKGHEERIFTYENDEQVWW